MAAIVILGKGDYAQTPLDQLPGWYLAHVLGGVAKDCPWEGLTEEQQAAVIAEDKRRRAGAPTKQKPVEPASSLESAQETHAKQVLQDTGGAAASAAPVVPETAEAKAAAEAESARLTGKGARKAKVAAESSASEANDIIASADLEELDNIEKAEQAGKNRVSVHAAIEKRRTELTAPE